MPCRKGIRTMLENKELIAIYKRDMELDTDMLSENTIDGHVRYITRFLESMDKPAFDITKSEINQYVMTLKRKDGKDANIDAKQNHMSAIKRFYNFLFVHADNREIIEMRYFYDSHGNQILIPNPADGLKSVNTSPSAKLLKNPRKEGMILTEAQQLLVAAREHMEHADDAQLTEKSRFCAHRDYTMILMMLEIGLRYSDICSLKISETSFDKTKRKMDVVVQKTKKNMTFFLSEVLLGEVEKYLKLHARRSDLLFCTSTGKKFGNKEVNEMLGRYSDAAGLDKKITCHTLRHTCGALMYQETKDLAFVKELLGHGSVTVTQRYVYSEDVVKNMGETTSKVTGRLVAAV